MFRHLTRGKNEKVQIRNIKNAEYPQKGCKEMVIPSVVKTNCTQSGHVIAIRTTSTDNPNRVDSHSWHFNQAVARQSLHIPYMNLAKGRNSQTVTPFRWIGPQSGNIAEMGINKSFTSAARYILEAHRADLFMVWSFSSATAFSNSTFISDTRIINNSIRKNAMSKVWGYDYPELTYDSYKFRDMLFYNSLGGVKTGTTIRRKNSLLCVSRFKHYRTTDSLMGTILVAVGGLRLVTSGMDIHGAIQYAFSSTNENANAAWLLNQRTQYGRRTNPIIQ